MNWNPPEAVDWRRHLEFPGGSVHCNENSSDHCGNHCRADVITSPSQSPFLSSSSSSWLWSAPLSLWCIGCRSLLDLVLGTNNHVYKKKTKKNKAHILSLIHSYIISGHSVRHYDDTKGWGIFLLHNDVLEINSPRFKVDKWLDLYPLLPRLMGTRGGILFPGWDLIQSGLIECFDL